MSWNGRRERPPTPCGKLSRYILITFNVLAWLFGITLVALSLWVLYDPALVEVRENLQLFAGYKAGIVIAISAAVGVCLMSLLGLLVFWHRSPKGLVVYSCLTLIVVITQIVAMAYIFKYATANKLRSWLSEKIREVIIRSKLMKKDAVKFLAHIQERYQCCGGFSYMDYTENEMDMPWSCYADQGVVYETGCGEVLVNRLQEHGVLIGLVAMAILLVQVGLCVCAWIQFFSKRVVRPRLTATTV